MLFSPCLRVKTQFPVCDAGDCRAVLCRNSKALQLNREHSTEDNSERDRVSKMGGKLQQVDGSWRLGSAGIQVTRSRIQDLSHYSLHSASFHMLIKMHDTMA